VNQPEVKTLTVPEAFAILAGWRSTKTRLFLELVDTWSSFKGTVRVLQADVDFPLMVRFTWILDGADNKDESFGASLIKPNILEEHLETETNPRLLVCRCEEGLRFVLAEISEDGTFEDFDLASMLEQ